MDIAKETVGKMIDYFKKSSYQISLDVVIEILSKSNILESLLMDSKEKP